MNANYISEDGASTGSDTSVESQAGSEPHFDLMSDEPDETGSPESPECPTPSNPATTNGIDPTQSPPSPGNKPYWAYPEHLKTSKSESDIISNTQAPPTTENTANHRSSRSRRPKLKLTRTAALSDQDSSEEENLDDDVFVDEPIVPLGLEKTVVLVADVAPEPPERGDSLVDSTPAEDNVDMAEISSPDSTNNGDACAPADEDPISNLVEPATVCLSNADGAIIQTFTPQPEAVVLDAGVNSNLASEPDGAGIPQQADALTAKSNGEIKEDVSAVSITSPELVSEEGSNLTTELSSVSEEKEQSAAATAANSSDMENIESIQQISANQVLVNLVPGTLPTQVQVSGTDIVVPVVDDDNTSLSGSTVDLPGEITVTLGVGEPVECSNTEETTGIVEPETEVDSACVAQTDRVEECVVPDAGSRVIEVSSEDLLTLNLTPVVRRRSPDHSRSSPGVVAKEHVPSHEKMADSQDTARSDETIETTETIESTETNTSASASSSPPPRADDGSEAPVVRMRENRAKLRRKRVGLSKVISKSFETGTMPIVDWDAFFDLLDSFWIYYVVLSVLAAFAASATGVSPFYLIVTVALFSFIGFALLSSLDDTSLAGESLPIDSASKATATGASTEADIKECTEESHTASVVSPPSEQETTTNILQASSMSSNLTNSACQDGNSQSVKGEEEVLNKDKGTGENPIEPALD